MTILSALAPVSFTSFFDPSNGAVKQASLYFYRAGTLDPITVYTDSNLTVPHPLPVLTTGYGRVPGVWVGAIVAPGYRVRVFDQYSVLVEDIDNIPGPVDPTGGGGGGGTINPGDARLLATGDLIFQFSNAQPRTGFVLANGKTIGPASAPATNRANADTQALFEWLWGQDLYGMLPVLPSRGTTAHGDWLDGTKHITLPDMQGRSPVGMDAMAATATNRLANVPMSAGTPDKVGARGGEALHTTLLTESPAHKHNVASTPHGHTISDVPAHSHGFTGNATGAAGAHNHTFTGTAVPNHFHDYNSTGALSPGTGGAFGTQVNNVVTAGTNTSSAGGHTPAGTIPAAPDHTHTTSGTVGTQAAMAMSAGTTTVAITEATIGGDLPHNNTPLFQTLAAYMKL
jgi:microcystin-dependent protein